MPRNEPKMQNSPAGIERRCPSMVDSFRSHTDTLIMRMDTLGVESNVQTAIDEQESIRTSPNETKTQTHLLHLTLSNPSMWINEEGSAQTVSTYTYC